MSDLVALDVQTPTVNGAQSFEQGAAAASDLNTAHLQQAQASIGLVGQVALGAMGGDINGKADPAKWQQGMALLKAHGLPVDGLSPDAAPMLARSSISTLGQIQTAQSQAELTERLQEFANTIQQQKFTNTMAVNAANYQQHSELQPQGFYGSTTPDAARAAAGLPPLPMIGADGKPVPAPAASPSAPAAPGISQASPTAPATTPAAAGTSVGGMLANSPGAMQAKTIGDGIISGDISPDTVGKFSRYSAPVLAYLKENGYDLTKAQLQIAAEKKFVQSANSTQQVKMRQTVNTVKDTVDLAKSLADQWKGSGFPAFNKATLQAALQGALGPEANSLATRLLGQIDDVTSELGTVYKGGNASTDESLSLAKSQLSGDWSQQTFDDAIKQIQMNIGFRVQALDSVGAAGIGPDNPYSLTTPGAQPDVTEPGAAAGAPTVDYKSKYGLD